jgi:hypothetical protein
VAVFGSWRNTARPSFRPCYLKGVGFWRPLWIAYVEIMQTVPSVLVQYCLMIKVSMTGRNYDCVESREGDSESAEDARSDNCYNEMDATGNCFHWKGQDEVG